MRIVLPVLIGLGIAAGGGYWAYDRGYLGFIPGLAKAPATAGAPAAGGSPGGGGPGGGTMAMPVSAAKVTVADFTPVLPATGSLLSNESVTIAPEIAGRLAEIVETEGQPIARGTVIARLDDRIAQAELQQARARLALAQANVQRASDLAAANAGTVRARDEAAADLRTQEANIAVAQARLERSRMVAPFDGVLGLRRVSAGDFVNAGQALITLEQIDPIKLEFRVPEVYLPQIQVGQSVAVEVDALRGESFEGRIYAIDPAIDEAGRSLVVRARLPNPKGNLRPGLFARVSVRLPTLAGAIQVPEEALIPRPNGVMVAKIVDGKAAFQPVKIGERRAGKAVVLEGLSPDDTVITAGYQKIGPGMPVMVLPPPNAAPNAPGAGQGKSS